jgi:hypothetical protein
VKLTRWTSHALENLVAREIDREEAEKTLAAPDLVVPGHASRWILTRRYYDTLLQQEMLLRMIVEETATERIVVTVYKTSQIARYLKS